jgi:hypothetical protein
MWRVFRVLRARRDRRNRLASRSRLAKQASRNLPAEQG